MSAKNSNKMCWPIKRYLQNKLKECLNLIDYSEEKSVLKNVLLRTIKYGESDSVLVVGSPGCGKTFLVEQSLSEVVEEFGSDSCNIVRLNGLIHLNDFLALRGIINQIHSAELDGGSTSGSFSDNLLFVLLSLKSGSRNKTKPIVFVVEEFQYFCNHKNQTLLYNLFDVAQSAQAPICVVGITCRIDITELFEKRVKSRFSHRQILLHYQTDIKHSISVLQSIFTLSEGSPFLTSFSKTFIRDWNNEIDKLLHNSKVISLLKRHFELSVNYHDLRSSLQLLICTLNEKTHSYLTVEDFENVFSVRKDDRSVNLIKDLSVLELCLVIAMKHQNEIYDGEPMNFEMVYKRYLKFAMTSSIHILHRAVVYKAFERLRDSEVVLPIGGLGRKTTNKEYLLYNLALTNQQINSALSRFDCLPTDISQWASSSLPL